MQRSFIVSAFVISLAFAGTVSADAPQRRFELRDSIEMADFVRPELSMGRYLPPVAFAPDGAHFVVVTRRGNLDTGMREATLWLFASDDVRAAVRGPADADFQKARALVRVASTSNREPLITWRWSSDSRSVLFLDTDDDGTRRLYCIGIEGGEAVMLSRADQDVSGFAERNDALVYLAHARTTREMMYQAGGPALPDIVVGTGQNILPLLFPHALDHFFRAADDDLWIVENGRARAILQQGSSTPITLRESQLALSPDGRQLVVTPLVKRIPKSWEKYQPQLDYPGARLVEDTPQTEGGKGHFRPHQYALVDLASGRMSLLVDAPIDLSQSFSGAVSAVWSEDGSMIAVAGSFAPLDAAGKPIGTSSYRHCAVAAVAVKTRDFSCVQVATPLDIERSMSGSRPSLSALRWQRRDRELEAQFSTADEPNKRTATTFRRTGKTWVAGGQTAVGAAQDTLLVEVDEALDRPPTLTARLGSGAARRIFDPNPQLRQIALGTAELYHWLDADGNEWTGGLVKPPQFSTARRYPLVIQTHNLDRAKFLVDGPSATGFAARALAARDIVVLQVDEIRKDFGTQKEFETAGAAGYRAAILQLTKEGIVDPAKVGIIAWSHMGPYLLQSMIDEPHAYVAGTLAESSYYSYGEYLMNIDYMGTEREQMFSAQAGAKPFDEGLKKWLEHSPGFKSERICSPLLFQFNSPLALVYGWDMYAVMRAQGKPVDMLYLRNGDHALVQPWQRLAEQGMNVDWYDYWLNGRKDSDPAKAEQYERWDAMKPGAACASGGA